MIFALLELEEGCDVGARERWTGTRHLHLNHFEYQIPRF